MDGFCFHEIVTAAMERDLMHQPEKRFIVVPSGDRGFAVRDNLRMVRSQQFWRGWFSDVLAAASECQRLIDSEPI